MIEDERSACFRVDFFFTSTIFDNEWWVLQESLLKLPLCGGPFSSPPLHLGNWITSGASSLKPPVQRKACLVPSRAVMSPFTENMYVIFCSWMRGPYAFYITLSYFWVGEKRGLLGHSQSDITLRSGLSLAFSSYAPVHWQQYPQNTPCLLKFYIMLYDWTEMSALNALSRCPNFLGLVCGQRIWFIT